MLGHVASMSQSLQKSRLGIGQFSGIVGPRKQVALGVRRQAGDMIDALTGVD